MTTRQPRGMRPERAMVALLALVAVGATFRRRSYQNLTTEDERLCSDTTKKLIVLGEKERSTLLVTQTQLGKHQVDWQHSFRCHFVVGATSGILPVGVFAVIQRLKLRRDDVTGDCIDYIKFKNRTAKQWGDKICGWGAVTDDDSPGRLANVDPYGKTEVRIFVDRKRLRWNEDSDFAILFTAFKDCVEEHESCRPPRSDLCIHSSLFGDGLVNCPHGGCRDEDGCAHHPDTVTTDVKVTIGTVTTLVLALALLTTCLWLCRRHRALCWSQDCAGPARPATPVAVELGAVSDKDPPPSYDTLFPPVPT